MIRYLTIRCAFPPSTTNHPPATRPRAPVHIYPAAAASCAPMLLCRLACGADGHIEQPLRPPGRMGQREWGLAK
eukprot:5127822-Pyramimonas_sp.AAC.1